jgi:pimeloyl-ACP methyl ester carboxylesterase
LEQLVEYIHPRIREFAAGAPVHFVVHSMGGLLVRAYLARYPETKIGRVVMLGTPNHGSEVADYMKDWRLYRWIFGPAGQQLVTQQQGISQLFGPVNFPLGIIAGNSTIDMFCSRIIGQTNDGKVSVESTKLQGMAAHIVLPVSHLGMLHSRMVRRHIVQFLKTGAF